MTGLLIIRATDEEAIGIFVEKIAVGDYGMADFLFGSLAGNPGYGTTSFGNFDVLAHPFRLLLLGHLCRDASPSIVKINSRSVM